MIKRWATKLAAGALIATAALGAGTAQATSTLKFDVNTLKAQAYAGSDRTGGTTAAFTETFTGSLGIDKQGGSDFANFRKNGVTQSIAGWVLHSFSATINFTGGFVTGGTFTFEVSKGGVIDTYTGTFFDKFGGPGETIDGPDTNGDFEIKVGTKLGAFSETDLGDKDFADVDIAQWFAQNGGLFGEFFTFDYNPGSTGLDTLVDVEMLVVVPAPPAVLWGLAGLGGLILGRKRLRSLGIAKR